jgi:hypothetical protein
MELPQDQIQTSELSEILSAQLKEVIAIEECNRKPERISQVLSEYEFTNAFIDLMKHFPEELSHLII